MLLHARSEPRPLAVGLADLDNFKPVNHSLGHEADDRLLIEVSRRLRTVAEGIETPEQFNYLMSLGCDEGQGYLMSRPVTPHAIAEMLGMPAPERNAVPAGWALAGRDTR